MKRAFFATVLILMMTASSAWAIDAQNVQPSMGPQNLLSLYTSDPLTNGQFAFGLLANYAGSPVRFEYEDNAEEINVVDRLLSAHAYAVVGLLNVLDIMAGGSYCSVSGEDLDQTQITQAEETSNTGIGDAFAGIKARILRNEPGSLGLALAAFGSFPTGNEDYFHGAGATNISGQVILDKRISLVNLVLNAGYRYMGDTDELEPAGQVFGGFGVDVAVSEWFGITGEIVGKTVDYGIEGIDATTPLEVLVGVRFFTPVGVNFLLAGGLGVTDGIGSPLYRGMAGISFAYPRVEYEQGEPSGRPLVAPAGVTPLDPREVDSDGDGLSNYDERELYHTNPLNTDTDQDGLLDGEEVNKYKTDPTKFDTDNDGLSDGSEVRVHGTDPLLPDTDGDTLPDGMEVNDLHTSPTNVDSDGDGVPDNIDGAPLEPETVNGYLDDDGVPEVVIARRPSGVLMLENQIVLLTPLTFDRPNGYRLSDADKRMLDDVAALLFDFPQVKIQIEGHVSPDVRNAKRLTERRALAVMNYLRSKGINATRLTAVGMGSEVPIASNDTAEGRRRNTRIDFIITER